MPKFPFFKQYDAMDCGPSCLRMIAAFYGKTYSLHKLRTLSHITREGVSLLGMSDAAEAIGFRTIGARITIEQLLEVPKPCVVHWEQEHFVVVYKYRKGIVYIADPAFGLVEYTVSEFKKHWLATIKQGEEKGICLMFDPTPAFFDLDSFFAQISETSPQTDRSADPWLHRRQFTSAYFSISDSKYSRCWY
jgi:ATP-binding cassette subfamily B protein